MNTTPLRTDASVAATYQGESSASAVSWAAIFAGAIAAAALSLTLLTAGSSLGFATMSPWGNDGASATTLGIGAIIWLIFTQIISAGLGGYMAGRLRTKWVNTHSDEAYFRDTAHGLLVWAVGALITAFMLTSALSSIVSGTARAGASALSGAGSAISSTVGSAANMASRNGNMGSMDMDGMVDSLFRGGRPDAAGNPREVRAEVGRIVSRSISRGDMTPEDKSYVASVISAQTGVDQATAEKRITDGIAQAKQTVEDAKNAAKEAADKARKAAAAFALWAFLSLMIGALSACIAATMGGKSRDRITH
ncbi:MAG: hypothetical protein ABW210_14925 [Achromobacter sp.]|jgi:hypothetical protein